MAEDVRWRWVMTSPMSSAFWSVIVAVFGIGLNTIELALVDPELLTQEWYQIFAIPYDLLIASGSLLVAAHFSARSDESGKLNLPMLWLLVATLLVYILVAISARPWWWVSPLDGVLRVWLPDLLGLSTLCWSMLVAQGLAYAQR